MTNVASAIILFNLTLYQTSFIHMNDLIQIIKILEPEEIEELNKYIDTLKFEKSSVFGKTSDTTSDDGCRVDENVRSSIGTTLDETHKSTMNLHSKINLGLDEYKKRLEKMNNTFYYYPVPGGIDTRSWREGIQILQYKKSEQYIFHHDAATRTEQKEYHRTISVIVYLNDGFEGGGTSFIHKTFKPKPGYALIFPSNWCYPHSGQMVESGIKRVAVTWYYVEQTMN